jgi:hypothetical protein
MLDGIMLLWFLLTAAALLFVAVDIRNTPESPVLKWGFLLLTAYTGVVGAFLYVLGAASRFPERMSATPQRAGGRRWDRPCTALPATASASSRARCCRACLASPVLPR